MKYRLLTLLTALVLPYAHADDAIDGSLWHDVKVHFGQTHVFHQDVLSIPMLFKTIQVHDDSIKRKSLMGTWEQPKAKGVTIDAHDDAHWGFANNQHKHVVFLYAKPHLLGSNIGIETNIPVLAVKHGDHRPHDWAQSKFFWQLNDQIYLSQTIAFKDQWQAKSILKIDNDERDWFHWMLGGEYTAHNHNQWVGQYASITFNTIDNQLFVFGAHQAWFKRHEQDVDWQRHQSVSAQWQRVL